MIFNTIGHKPKTLEELSSMQKFIDYYLEGKLEEIDEEMQNLTSL